MSKSTVLEGNHVFPPFYACYLLLSRATPESRRTYVGSTPDPPRRIRQHNGEISQGAWKTSKHRPWEMQMIVYGFPSKLAALQFEWAWQKPELSRHLRLEASPIFKKDSKRNWVERKIAVCCALLRVKPFSRLPLHLRFFTPRAYSLFESSQTTLPRQVTIILDLGGVRGDTGRRRTSTRGVISLDGPIDVKDADFRGGPRVLNKWHALRGAEWTCNICRRDLDLSNHLDFALCPASNECGHVAHLSCLAPLFLSDDPSSLLPHSGSCPECGEHTEWGEIIRACYGRKADDEPGGRKARRKGRTVSDPESEAETRSSEQGRMVARRVSVQSRSSDASDREWEESEQDLVHF